MECSRGWGQRCPASKGKKCRCKCGGSNHGTARQREEDRGKLLDDQFPLDKDIGFHARWDLVAVSPKAMVIRDVGHRTCRSVSNDAEWVVSKMIHELAGRRLFYYDSMGNLDELVIRDGRFADFAPGPGAITAALTGIDERVRDKQVADWEASVKANPPKRVTDFSEVAQ